MNTFMQMLKPLIQLLYNKIVLESDDKIAKIEADAEAYRQAMTEMSLLWLQMLCRLTRLATAQ